MYILDCSAAEEMCTNLQPFLNVIKVLFGIVRWTVPIVLIVFGTIDMFKTVTKAEDEKSIQDARRSLIKRIIYGVVVFLVPLIVNIVMELIDEGVTTTDEVTATTWVSCWNNTIDTSKCDDIYAPEVEPETSSENGNGYIPNNSGEDDDKNKCLSYTCPTGKFLGSDKKLDLIYYKNSCYCRGSIPSATLYDGSSCSDISNAGTFAFSETDSNSADDYCYFKAKKNSSSNQDESKKCYDYSCKQGKLQQTTKTCINKVTKPTDLLPENNNCKYACGKTAISYNEYQDGSGFDICQCEYEAEEKEVECK